MGWTVETVTSRSEEDTWNVARDAVEKGYDGVIACGGDGTLNQVSAALSGSEVPLCVVHGGTSNVWAREATIPRQPLAAIRLLVEGRRQRMDLGMAKGAFNERSFMLMAGVGFDAGIVRAVSPEVKRLLGAAAYALQGALNIMQLKPREVKLRIDGEYHEVQMLQMVLGNTRLYGGVTQITRDAFADDGVLDLCLYEGNGLPQIATHVAWTLVSAHPEKDRVLYRRVYEVEVLTEGLPVQLDGDYVGDTPATFGVRPAAVTVCLPLMAQVPFLAEG